MKTNFKNYIDIETKEYVKPHYIARYSGSSTHRIEILEAEQNARFFIEPAHNNCPPICFRSSIPTGESAWENDVVDFEEISRMAGSQDTGNNRSAPGAFFSSFHSTSVAQGIGISPSYLSVRAKADGARIGISNGFIGELFCLQAGEIPFVVRPGAFVMCEVGVILDTKTVEHYASESIHDAFLNEQFGYNGFMKIFGEGLCFLQGGSFLDIIELEPRESFSCDPKRIMGFFESVRIKRVDTISSIQSVRNAMGMEFGFTLESDERGGMVCMSNNPVTYNELYK